MLEVPSMASSEVNFKVQDEGRLAELGYTQELRREWSLLHNFGASFSIIVCYTHTRQKATGRLLTVCQSSERGDWYHNVRNLYTSTLLQFEHLLNIDQSLRLWPQYRWSWCHDHWMDHSQLLQ